MATAFELGGNERGDARARHLGADQAGAYRNGVRVVVRAAQARGERLGDLRAAHLGVAVDRDGDADARAAQRDAALRRARGDRRSELVAIVRIIDAVGGVRPEVGDLEPLLAEPGD